MGLERWVIEKTISVLACIRTTDTVALSPHMQILKTFSPQHPVDEENSTGRRDSGPMLAKRRADYARRTTNPSGHYDVGEELGWETANY